MGAKVCIAIKRKTCRRPPRRRIKKRERKAWCSNNVDIYLRNTDFQDMNIRNLPDKPKQLQDNLRSLVLSLETEFIKFLKPRDVIFDIQGLDDCLIEEILNIDKSRREQAVKDLLTNILEDADLLPKFVFVLESKGYSRFGDSINNMYPEKGTMFCQLYFEFIMNLLTGKLADVLKTLKICRYLYGIGFLEQSDMEHIETVHSKRGREYACQKLMIVARRNSSNWVFLMLEAIQAIHEYNDMRRNPSLAQGDIKDSVGIGSSLLKDSGCGSLTTIRQEDHELQDDLQSRFLSLQQDFIKFLKPSDVMFDIQGLDECRIEEILETEKTSREQAVKDLLSIILKDPDLLSKFVFALQKRGYRRFIDPINDIYPEKGHMFCQEYFEFIMNLLKGELADVLETLQICRYLYGIGCLEQSDMEHIKAVYSTTGRTAACRELIITVRRKKANWALLMVEAISATQEYVKVKMDHSSTQEDLVRTGVRI